MAFSAYLKTNVMRLMKVWPESVGPARQCGPARQ